MTLLPIVERELRVAARSKITYRIRIYTAVVGIIITGILLAVKTRTGGAFSVGSVLFMTLGWLSFIFACFAGVVLTSDSISEERREGTLGLLFLTDLRGYDIILGKLISSSLQSFYGLLAIFPVLALPLLMGGVTGADFWRMQLVLVNGLFFSLALGMFVSSINHDSQKALHTTFFLLALVLVGFPLLDPFYQWTSMKRLFLAAASPGTIFAMTLSKNYKQFWSCLAISNASGWVFLGLASYYTPRLWQQKTSPEKSESRSYNLRFGSPERRKRFRAKLMQLNPVCWLVARTPRPGFIFQLFLWIGLVIMTAACLTSFGSGNSNSIIQGVGAFLGLALLIWMASQASKFFVEGHRNGALELLLCTPLTVKEMIQGQWLALKRLFFLPVVLILALQILVGVLETRGSILTQTYYFDLVVGLVNSVLDLITYGWVAMWLGLVNRKASVALMKTFLFVMIIPWFATTLLQIIQIFLLSKTFFGLPLLTWITTFLWVVKDIAFILWARRNLYSRLREIASDGAIARKPANLLPPANVPPVIVSAA